MRKDPSFEDQNGSSRAFSGGNLHLPVGGKGLPGARSPLRHCERSEAIHGSATRLWIASLRSQ
ncbi:hypothetical protein [Novosphingobium kaempferiae]|uniref:hypothetical protein n=1 Tax=Novosphingobium kaempferiae TaxID=2896849 RepID=UPI001E58B8A8|nr:hypothetical protein [Novosphingobium kaempferiae]